MCACTMCEKQKKKRTGRTEKNGGAGDDGGGQRGEVGGSGFCARDDKFGGQRFAPENLSQ